MRKYSFILLPLILLLGACGFQLRGQYPLPPGLDSVYVQGNVSRHLMQDLQQVLRRSGVRVASSAESASAILNMHQEDQDRRILSVGSSARVSEYEVIYRLEFSLRMREGAQLLDHETVVLRRDYSFNEDDVLAKEREERILRREMQREGAQLVLRRIAYSRPQPEKQS